MHLIIHMIMAVAAMGVMVLSDIHDNGVETPVPTTALTNWTSSHGENASQQIPIGFGWKIPMSRVRRICQELCSVGLGGIICGSECLQTLSLNIRQLHLSRPNKRPQCNDSACEWIPRRRVCPTLCMNGLGKPLCHCDKNLNIFNDNFVPIWNDVCDTYCKIENYQLSGCGQCSKTTSTTMAIIETSTIEIDEKDWYEYFLSLRKQSNSHDMKEEYLKQLETLDENAPDWDEWCHEKCMEQDGGAACNCNLTPF